MILLVVMEDMYIVKNVIEMEHAPNVKMTNIKVIFVMNYVKIVQEELVIQMEGVPIQVQIVKDKL